MKTINECKTFATLQHSLPRLAQEVNIFPSVPPIKIEMILNRHIV